MQWKLHVRFGGRAGETHQPKSRKGAPVRPLHRTSHDNSATAGLVTSALGMAISNPVSLTYG